MGLDVAFAPRDPARAAKNITTEVGDGQPTTINIAHLLCQMTILEINLI